MSLVFHPGVLVKKSLEPWTLGQVLYAFSDALDFSEPVASLPLLHCEAGFFFSCFNWGEVQDLMDWNMEVRKIRIIVNYYGYCCSDTVVKKLLL